MAYLIQGSEGDFVADKDSVDRWNGQICLDSGGVLDQFDLSFRKSFLFVK